MEPALRTTRVYLNAQREGSVTCSHCGVTQTLTMATYPGALGGKFFKGRCGACGRVFGVAFDLRRYPRIAVTLPGRLFPAVPQAERDEHSQKLGYTAITVTSLSSGGLGFSPMTPRPFHRGERYHVVFFLMDPDHTMICEDIIIQRLSPPGIGAAFADEEHAQAALDRYIYFLAPLGDPARV